MSAQITAFTNQKGGVAKTTTTVNLGVGLAREGKKVLLVDGDPQGSLTISMGIQDPDELTETLSTLAEACRQNILQYSIVVLTTKEVCSLVKS